MDSTWFKQHKIWRFPKLRESQNEWFIVEHHIKLYDLGVPLFQETTKHGIEARTIQNTEPDLYGILADYGKGAGKFTREKL